MLLVGIAWTAVLTLLTPIIAEAGDFAGIIVIRILEGLGSVSIFVKGLISSRMVRWILYFILNIFGFAIDLLCSDISSFRGMLHISSLPALCIYRRPD